MAEISTNKGTIKVTAGQNIVNVGVTKDFSQYYSNLSKDWATKMNGLVLNEDYSSKYYANKAKDWATSSEDNLTAIIKEHTDITTEINNAKEDISTDLSGALLDIQTTAETSIKKLQATAENTISTGITNITNTKDEAETSITSTKNTAVKNITDTKTSAENAITTAKTNALNAITKEGATQVSNVKQTGFYMQDGNLYYIDSKGNPQEFKQGGGLDLATVVCMPFGIDESENKYRYLNGQTIIQEQFPEFTKKVKSWQSTRANLFATETNWQAEKTASKLGQCGKFVVDDTAGTIRLPLVININGLTDLANCGMVKDESLPNITGYIQSYGEEDKVFGGAFSKNTSKSRGTAGGQSTAYSANFNASLATSTYQDNAPVQQEAIQYPYVIVVNTGVEEAERPINNYQVNNVYSLFDCKFADHKLNNSSWLRSEGQYNSGTVYTSPYQELLAEYNNTESTEETENGVTFKRTPKGYKIALASQKTTIDSLYSSTGVAWYYVLDTANEQFMLPRTKYGFSGVRSKAGNYISESLPNINGSLGVYPRFNTAAGAFKLQTPITGLTNTNGLSFTASNSVAFDASLYSSTYQDGAPVQERSTEMYLYFYIGDTLQNADLINIARLGEELVDIKADKLNKTDVVAYVIETYVNGESGYNLYSNNYIEQWGRNHTETATITFLKPFKDTNYNVCTNVIGHIGNNYYGIDAGSFTTTTMYVNWDGGEENGSGFFWKVSGYLA